jgi:hypothetical protein
VQSGDLRYEVAMKLRCSNLAYEPLKYADIRHTLAHLIECAQGSETSVIEIPNVSKAGADLGDWTIVVERTRAPA